MSESQTNKLPEGVGKRIIESLKNQEYEMETEAGLEQLGQYEESSEYNYNNNRENDDNELNELDNFDNFDNNEEISRSQEVNIDSQPKQEQLDFNEEQETIYSCAPEIHKKDNHSQEKQEYNSQQNQSSFGESDIDTLLNLINQLPSGVTKQTGAFIIRQTMEAMGISMNKVLSDAQSVQEELENNIKNNVNVIEEYRTKVKILEQEIQKYRKKAHELEDIISLFILSDDKK